MAGDRRTTIETLIDRIEHDSSELAGRIEDIGRNTYNALRFIDRQEDLTDEEYGKYIEKVQDALYSYLEFSTYISQRDSELGHINSVLRAFARGMITVEDVLRSL